MRGRCVWHTSVCLRSSCSCRVRMDGELVVAMVVVEGFYDEEARAVATGLSFAALSAGLFFEAVACFLAGWRTVRRQPQPSGVIPPLAARKLWSIMEPIQAEAPEMHILQSVLEWVGLAVPLHASLHELLGTGGSTHPRVVTNIAEADYNIVLDAWRPGGRPRTPAVRMGRGGGSSTLRAES